LVFNDTGNRLKRLSFLLSLVAALACGSAVAQTAYRCDVNGQTVYSEKPCVDGKAIAPTQDSKAQRARSRDATKQIRDDDKAVSKRIADRSKEEAKERSEIRKNQAAADKHAAKEKAKAEKEAKKKAKKSSIKSVTKKTTKAKKKDNRAAKPSKT
jgi:FtsZ-interacting cell division protein ZipA